MCVVVASADAQSLQGSKGLGDELGSEVLSVGSVANLSDVYSIIFLKFFLAPDSLICTTDLCKRFMARCAFSPVHSVSTEKLQKLKHMQKL